MTNLNTIAVLLAVALLAGCSGDIPTAASEAGETAAILSKGDNGAQVFRGPSDEQILLMVDEKEDLLMIAYASETFAEAAFATFDVFCDLPPAEVQLDFQNVTNASNNSGMWRFRGSAAVAVYHYEEALIFPPPAPINLTSDMLVAYGILDAYRESGNDFWFGADRTLTFGLTAKGQINNALGPGQIGIQVNGRGMYRASDIQRGIFNALQRNTNIRLSPDPRD